MKSVAVLAAALAMAWAAPAFAGSCPTDMKEIDEALSKKTRLSADDLDKIKKMRVEGEELHKAGKHEESMDILDRAKTRLGI